MFDAFSCPLFSRNAVFAGLGAVCLVGVAVTSTSVYAQSSSPTVSQQQQPQKEPSETQTTDKEMGTAAVGSDDAGNWRAPLLAEMGRLANDLDAQRRLNILLEDRVEYMTQRLDTLEQRSLQQAERIESLQDALRQAFEAQSSGETAHEEPSDQAEMAPRKKDEALNGEGKKSSAPSDEEDEEMASDFERFLDMGEAMMRRFFGVVKEFRKDFDDNRV
ncbi:hypothetical protein [uncultured Cohaesibacter sp.]|uniref:hypothetical protein n=1 Tax=uncultured Cohaesibacter sp. TaxID=1002546 RepID=UPI002AAB1F73|nr:hypothetical protein [uncultured Cohaesibacter sp.]